LEALRGFLLPKREILARDFLTLAGNCSKHVQNSGSADDFTERAWPCPHDNRLKTVPHALIRPPATFSHPMGEGIYFVGRFPAAEAAGHYQSPLAGLQNPCPSVFIRG
jgi:hypothetical protein